MLSSLPPSSRLLRYATMLVGILVVAGLVALEEHLKQKQLHVARSLIEGDPGRAPPALRRYGCTGCHTIQGIPGAAGLVGGDLTGLRKRVYIAGVLNNTSDNLVRWIVSPQSFSPRSAMPTTGISEAEARDVAAYLYASGSD